VSEVATALERFGPRYVRRVFTPRESRYCRAATGRASAERFAVRVAAKEAVLKALRFDGSCLNWRAIEVRRHASGWCDIALSAELAACARRQGVTDLALSMSHDQNQAWAVVVGRARPRAGRVKA
jgi:holo-[acyl-carrier protein] synthase